MTVNILKKYYWIIFLLLPFTVGASTCWWFTAFVGEDSENSPTEACLDVFPTPTQAIPLIPQGNPPPGDPIIQGGEPVGNPPEELPPPSPKGKKYKIKVSYIAPDVPPSCTGGIVSPPGSPQATSSTKTVVYEVDEGSTMTFSISCPASVSPFCYYASVYRDGTSFPSAYCGSGGFTETFSNINADHELSVAFWSS